MGITLITKKPKQIKKPQIGVFSLKPDIYKYLNTLFKLWKKIC
jgi:hypothetical protein